MNNTRRCMLKKSIEDLWDAIETIKAVAEEEQESFDNLPEGIQWSERGELMEENIYNMEEIIEGLEEYIGTLEDM